MQAYKQGAALGQNSAALHFAGELGVRPTKTLRRSMMESENEKEECGNCDGTGMADCPMEYGGACPEHCPACGGDQKVVCADCNGTGWQESW